MGPWRGVELKSDTSESAASRREAATDDGLGEPARGSNKTDNDVGNNVQYVVFILHQMCDIHVLTVSGSFGTAALRWKEVQLELRPVEASWKSGSVRWRDGFLAAGLTSDLSATGRLLLSSVSL